MAEKRRGGEEIAADTARRVEARDRAGLFHLRERNGDLYGFSELFGS